MNNLDLEHYQSIIKRGKIDSNTDLFDFIEKIREEFKELLYESFSIHDNILTKEFIQEAIDLRQAITNMLIHFNIDIKSELKENIQKQINRSNDISH